MKKYFFLITTATALLLSCTATRTSTSGLKTNGNEHLVMAVAWYQHSAEATALCYQAFNIARFRLDQALANGGYSKLPAVVVDIDETMLDNSPYETRVINHTDNSNGWYGWTNEAIAKPVPGALEFALYSQSRNVPIFYITNRDDNERKSTLANLAKAGFPFANEEHLLTKQDLSYTTGNTSSKAGRRAKVSENHEIVLLIGDNLNDFSELFEDRSTNDGKNAVSKNQQQFGEKFILLPNPMYGAWEKPLYQYNEKLTDTEKAEWLRKSLR
jgi:5'-nucleotidase (lipoprotein e(P4) family)